MECAGMEKDSRIYIAGHTGLLGSAILHTLKSRGYRDIVTRFHSDLDLTDQRDVNDFFKEVQPEYVFLTAGLTGGIIANKTYPATFLHTNISIQDNVFEAARINGVRNLVFYGSSCIYPKYSPQPIKEEYLMTGEIEETSEGYAIAKTAGILACRTYNTQYRRNRFIALIPNSMYGPGDHFDLENSHVLAALIRKFHEGTMENRRNVTLWGTGFPRREFIFHEDVADASLFAMNNVTHLNNTHYNVGSGIDLSIKELAEIIADIVGFSGEIIWDTTKPDGTPQKLLDSSRILDLGWRPSTDIRTGIKKTYDWYVKNMPTGAQRDVC